MTGIPDAPDIAANRTTALGAIPGGMDQCPDSTVAAVVGYAYRRYLRFCRETAAWLFWNGRRWQADDASAVINKLVLSTISTYLHPMLPGLTAYKKSGMLNNRYVKGVIAQLQERRELRCGVADFDADAFLAGMDSGVLDLRNGGVYPPAPEMMISLRLGCDMAAPEDTAPQWNAFIRWLTCGDKELARFLRMWLGSSLIGNNRDQKIVFLWGDSANGKSVLLRAVSLVAGEYHRQASPSLFMARRHSDHGGATPGLAKILGGRLVTGTEVPKGAEWDTQVIKQLCSDEKMTTRKLYADEVDMSPRCSVTLAGNDLPAFTGLDDAIRRRFITAHCRAKVAPAEQRADYGMELFLAEGPAILRWLVAGALDRETNGWFEPAIVAESSEAYFAGEDVLVQFVAEHYEIDPDGEVGTTEMYQDWQAYNKGLGRPRDLTQTAFVLRLKRMGYEKGHDSRTRRGVVKGLRKSSTPWDKL